MTALVLAIVVTISLSALCSLFEAMILSTTAAEIEALKNVSPLRGALLERFKTETAETSSAILSLNTLANTLGATLVGWLAALQFPHSEQVLLAFAFGMAGGILIFSEIIPKNVGVLYRSRLHKHCVYPLQWVRLLMRPLSWVCRLPLRVFVRRPEEPLESSDDEIVLLAEKGAKEGTLSTDESDMIANALRLDDVSVRDIMTPRTVVTALDQETDIRMVFQQMANIPFARIPVYKDSIDNVVGIVRRRDLLKAKADDADATFLKQWMQKAFFVPENATALDALRLFLKHHQQLAIAVDEFGSMSGVISMEDIVEQILGQEIFEKDDVAVDMRELARRKKEAYSDES